MNSKKSLLIIEDNDHHYQLLRQSLNNGTKQFTITRTTDSEKGKKLLKSHRFDLILTENNDISAPEEWLTPLKQNSHGAPIVVLTTTSDQQKAIRAMKMGADDYIIKSRDTLKSLPKSLLKLLENKRKKYSILQPKKEGGFNLLARNLQTISNLISHPAKSFAQGKKSIKQFNLLEKEIKNIKSLLKNLM